MSLLLFGRGEIPDCIIFFGLVGSYQDFSTDWIKYCHIGFADSEGEFSTSISYGSEFKFKIQIIDKNNILKTYHDSYDRPYTFNNTVIGIASYFIPIFESDSSSITMRNYNTKINGNMLFRNNIITYNETLYPTVTPTPRPTEIPPSKPLSIGLIIGIVFACIAVIVIIVIILCYTNSCSKNAVNNDKVTTTNLATDLNNSGQYIPQTYNAQQGYYNPQTSNPQGSIPQNQVQNNVNNYSGV